MDSEQVTDAFVKPSGAIRALTFGEPEPVINKRQAVLDLLESRFNGRFYKPPIDLDGLSRAYVASPHHQAAINLKRDLLSSLFLPSQKLSRREFTGFALDYLVLGNGYLEAVPNRIGGAAMFKRAIGKYVRRGKDDDEFYQVKGWREIHEFARGSIIHAMQPNLDQEIYGVPDYVSALQAAFLNENATLFRRKYYLNGSHAGYILHLDGQFSDGDVESVEEQLKQSKGPGNFRNLLLHSVGGSKDSVKLIPISEVAAKDEFLGIKNTTRDDVLAAHRVFQQLVAVMPGGAGNFGDMDKMVKAFMRLVIEPIQMQLLDLNDALGAAVIAFRPISEILDAGEGASAA